MRLSGEIVDLGRPDPYKERMQRRQVDHIAVTCGNRRMSEQAIDMLGCKIRVPVHNAACLISFGQEQLAEI